MSALDVTNDKRALRRGPEIADLRRLRAGNLLVLSLSAFVFIAAFVLQFEGDAALALPGSPTPLPTTCASRVVLGIDCPACGLTRSFAALAKGRFAESIRFHRLGWLVALAVAIQIPYRFWALRALRRGRVIRDQSLWLFGGLFAALVMNWMLESVGC